MKNLITISFILASISIYGQQIDQNNSEWMQYLYNNFEENETSEDYHNLFEELSSIILNPFNLQTITKEELEKFPFLSDQQIENLLYYLYKYSPLVDIYELKNVEGLDIQTIIYLLPFVYLGDTEQKKSYLPADYKIQKLTHEILISSNYTLQEKAGYKKVSEEERLNNLNKYYLGNPLYLNFRYNLTIQNKIQFGISGEKDAGEKFSKRYPYGFDYYTFNFLMKDIGIIKEFHLGNYRLSFGEGLVINNNFSIGKTTDVNNINQRSNGIKRHLSTNEGNYFSGVAVQLKKRNFGLHLFYSQKEGDGNTDSLNIYSMKTDGFHRTYNDLIKKNTFTIEMFGQHFSWENNSLSLGVTSVYYSFNGKKLNPDTKPYNLFYLRDESHFNIGTEFNYQRRKIQIRGEAAIDKSGKTALLINNFFKPVSFFHWVVSYRYYDKEYNTLLGKSFGESTSIQNENGIYMGMKLNFRHIELSSFVDYFKFPWIKYGIDSPSKGEDISISLRYFLNSHIQMNLNLRQKEKEKNASLGNKKTVSISPYRQRKIKYQLNHTLTNAWKLKSEIQWKQYYDIKKEQGWSFSQSGSFISPSSKLQLDGGIIYFLTDNWNTRMNTYEKNILYSFSLSSFYGKGLRHFLVLKWHICKPLTFYFKYGTTYYFDRNNIGSVLEEIDGSIKTDLYGLIKYKF